MAGINANHVNIFISAANKILQDMCGFTAKIGKPSVKPSEFTEDMIVIIIGVTGEMKGQVMLSFSDKVACDIASKMMMMPVSQLDEISISAISELGNMIMGNASTVFSVKGVGIDITPPTMCRGNVSFQGSVANLSIPIYYSGEADTDKYIGLNLAVKQE